MNLGTIGKLKVAVKFLELGYDVFNELDGKSPFDLVVHHDNSLKRVEVKSTGYRNNANTGWVVQLKQVRPNKTVNKIIQFDPKRSDFLGIFIEPLNKVLIIKSELIKVFNELLVLDKDIAAYEFTMEELILKNEEETVEVVNTLF